MKTVAIIGAGFAGCTAAHLLAEEGFDVTLFEKDDLGGGCKTFTYCGHPFTYGPRLYYGYSDKIFKWVNSFVPLRRFPFELRTLAHEFEGKDRKFWSYPPHQSDIEKYPRAKYVGVELNDILKRTVFPANAPVKQPQNFDEYYKQRIGPTLYDMFTDHYSRKMWMIGSNTEFDLFSWSVKDNPIESGTREAYKGSYLGYPISYGGYNDYFTTTVFHRSIHIIPHKASLVDSKRKFIAWGDNSDTNMMAFDIVINTGPIDELLYHRHGELPYAGRDFQTILLPCKQVFPGDVRFCHYAGDEPHTRITEFKKITYYESEETLLLIETPSMNNKLYPYITKKNVALAKQYIDALPQDVYTIGRLGTYKYSTIEQTIAQAFECVSKITGKPNEMAGEFFNIGDKGMIGDRKSKAD